MKKQETNATTHTITTQWLEELQLAKGIVKTRVGGGGKQLSYLEGKWYIERLNAVIGTNWEWQVVNVQSTGISYIVHGRLTINGVTRDGIGGSDLKFASKSTSRTLQDVAPEGFENCVKSAETDAFKRACEKFGLGLFLSVSDEARTEAMSEAKSSNLLEQFKQLAQSNDTPNANKIFQQLPKAEKREAMEYANNLKQLQ
jgi:hypothetical protein